MACSKSRLFGFQVIMANKFKITHTSKKTGVETVIFDNTSDNIVENVGDLLTGVPITESVDDGMSNVVLHLKSCKGDVSIPELFEPYDKVEIERNVNGFMRSELYIVAIDNRKVDNENLETYEKTISLVEATKILDSIFIYNCNLTNKDETLYAQFIKLLKNAEIRVGEASRLYSSDYEYNYKNDLKQYKSEDFFFENVTLREALYRLFEVAHVRPYVKNITFVKGDISKIDITHISKVQFSEISSLSNAGKFIGDEAEISIDNYFGTIKARGYNSISKKAIRLEPRPFTTTEAQLTTDNMIADLGFPVEDITYFGVGSDASVGSRTQAGVPVGITYRKTGATYNENVVVVCPFFWDITDNLIDSEIYQLLTTDEKNISIPYTRGDSIVGVSKSYKTILFTHWTLEEILQRDLNKKADSDIYKYFKEHKIADVNGSTEYLNYTVQNLVLGAEIKSLFFRADFIPRFNTVLEIAKPGVYDNDRLKVAMSDNQSANSIDIARHGRSLSGLARRTGNEEITPNFICDGFTNLFPVMGKFTGLTGRDSYLNDYVITKREYAIYDDFLKVKYSCTKDYQAINEKIGVDREKRLYDIPLEASDCPIFIKYFITLNAAAQINKTEFTAPILFNAVRNLVVNGYDNENRFNYLYLATNEARAGQTINGETVKLEDNQYFALPLLPYASDKSVVLAAQTLDNYSVGYSRSGRKLSYWGGGGMQMLYNPYTDKNGECNGFTLCLASRQSVVKNIDKYPKVTKGGESLISDDLNVYYQKDRTQRPVFFIAFEFLPSKQLYGKVVFGEAVASQNFFVVSEAPEARYVYSSGEVYREGETRVKGTKLGTAGTYFIWNTDNGVYITVRNNMPLSNSIKSYAIGDESGNLLIAFNMALTKDEKLYFNISRKL